MSNVIDVNNRIRLNGCIRSNNTRRGDVNIVQRNTDARALGYRYVVNNTRRVQSCESNVYTFVGT